MPIDVNKYLSGSQKEASALTGEIEGREKAREGQASEIYKEITTLKEKKAAEPQIELPDLSKYQISEKDIPKIRDTYQNMSDIGKIVVSLGSVIAGAQLYHLDPMAPLGVYTSMVAAFRNRDIEDYMRAKDEFTQKISVMKNNMDVEMANTELKFKAAQLGDRRYENQLSALASRLDLLKAGDGMLNNLHKRLAAVQKNMDDIIKEAIKQQRIYEREVSVSKMKGEIGAGKRAAAANNKEVQKAIKALDVLDKTLIESIARIDRSDAAKSMDRHELARVRNLKIKLLNGEIDPKDITYGTIQLDKNIPPAPSEISGTPTGASRFKVEEVR